MTGPVRRSWWRWPAMIAGLVLALGLAVWLSLPPVAAFFMERALRQSGFSEAGISAGAVHFGLGTVTIDRIALGDDLSLRAVRLDAPLSKLVQGEAAALEIGTVAGRAQWSPGEGMTVPGYRPAPGPLLTALPVSRIEIRQLTIDFASSYGDLEAAAREIAVTASGPRLDFAGTLRLTSEHGTVDGRIDGSADLAERGVTARYTLSGGTAAGEQWQVGGLGGTVSATAGAGQPFRAEVDITVSEAEAARFALGATGVTGTWKDGRFEGRIRADDSAVPQRIDAAVAGDFSREPPTFSSTGTLNLRRESGVSGDIAYDAAMTVDLGGDPVYLSGNIALTAEAVGVPDAVADGAARFDAAIEGPITNLTVTFDTPIIGHITPAGAVLPEALAGYAGAPVDFRIQGADQSPLSLRVDATAPAVAGAVSIEIAPEPGEARLAGDMALRHESGGVSAAITGLDLSVTGLAWAGGTIDSAVFRGDGRASSGGDWALAGKGRLAASGTLGAGTYDDLQLDWSGTIAGNNERVRLTPDSCVAIGVRDLEWADIRIQDLTLPCLDTPGKGTLFSYRRPSGEIRFDIETTEQLMDMVLITDRPRPLTGRWPAVTASGRLTAAGWREATADIAGGALRMEDAAVLLTDMAGDLTTTPGDGLNANLEIGSIRSLSQPALWTPFSLDMKAAGKDGTTTFEAFLSDALGLFVLEAAGSWSGARGTADLTLYPINFLSGATEMGDLSPWLAGMVSDVSGRVAFDGQVAWGAAFESGGVVTIDDLSAQVSAVHLAGINGKIALASLLPPATDGAQTLRIDRVDAGVPLTDGRITVNKPQAGPPEIGPLSLALAGGTVTAAPFILDLSETGETRFTLEVENVDLARMIQQSDIDGLTGTGTLAGRVPVVVTPDGLSIESGGLQAVSDGALHYMPDELPRFLQGDDQRARMLRQVLQNFQYNDLSVSLAGAVAGDSGQKVTLAAKGSNPDFLDGHPVELNFNFEGSLLSALKSAVSVSGMDRLQRLFEKQEGQGTE